MSNPIKDSLVLTELQTKARALPQNRRVDVSLLSPVYTARAFVANRSDERSFVRGSGSVNSFGEPSKPDPPNVGFPANHQRDARSPLAQCKHLGFLRTAFTEFCSCLLAVEFTRLPFRFETTYDTVKSKITSLLASFRREKNKEETSKGTGKGKSAFF
ncbi:hypothetical protein J6590_084804 [Homalodisca vitripennis]|nr:hypothetical protein J6590_084804 [Homalodisca vitripennis]